jgi:hypothetical protein
MTAGMLWVETTTNEEARALDRQMWDCRSASIFTIIGIQF